MRREGVKRYAKADYSSAFEYFTRAAELGDAEAHYQLSLIKVICDGCFHANYMREFEERLENRCPFCRKDLPKTYEECDKQKMKRVEANDPVAMYEVGFNLFKKGNYSSAFGYWMKAAELGDAAAHYRLSCMYHNGDGVEKDGEKEMIVEKDCEKEVHHLEEAAIGGHPRARHNLGFHEYDNGNIERAVKHWIIAAAQGHDGSIKALMYEFRRGFVSKDDLAAALRAHQAAVDATKSPQREAAEAAQKKYRK
ncbi:Sel1-like repeat family protein [Skeletonema marinoi]|uniref:Sel1-like repeat family protein n=1 Tax=Skeletonema marinoi TaxID=267567 RepID=A0AAD8XTY3_9STRA|nr:Sel1-like repeat family protein [Skeletonema marinoi]